MDNEKADRIINLLDSIENKLDSIYYAVGGISSECQDISSNANRLRNIEDAVDSIRRHI